MAFDFGLANVRHASENAMMAMGVLTKDTSARRSTASTDPRDQAIAPPPRRVAVDAKLGPFFGVGERH